MSENLIYMVCIDHETSKIKNSSYARFSKASWYQWCLKNNVDIIFNEIHDGRFGRPIWNKELIHEIGKPYKKIGIVDSDTMININAPNIFDQFEDWEFCGVNDLCDLGWLMGSIDLYGKFFPGQELDIFKYLNAGVLFFGNRHLHIFEKLLNFYFENKEELDNWNKGGGREQTLLNFFLQKYKIPITLLTPAWNLLSIHKKKMFTNNWQLHGDKKHVIRDDIDSYPHFMKYGYIWHFTGFPPEEREYYMSAVWDLTKENLIDKSTLNSIFN